MMNSTREIIETLSVAPHVVVATHEKPDGDALGSALGLCRILREAGVCCDLAPPGVVAARFAWMVAEGEVLDDDWQSRYDSSVLAVLDCGTADRAAPFVEEWIAAERVVINIDHHASNTEFGLLNWVDTEASSVGEMICRLADDAEWDVSAEAAEALWVAIVTDTGRFAYQNTSPQVMRAAAGLLVHPIPTAQIDQRVYNSVSAVQLRLQARALDSLALHEDGVVALICLSEADFAELDCGAEDAEDFVNLPRSISGVGVAGFLYEVEKEIDGSPAMVTKVSLRTTEAYDAAELCRGLGGGGHARAAGCTIVERLPQATERLLAAFREQWFLSSS